MIVCPECGYAEDRNQVLLCPSCDEVQMQIKSEDSDMVPERDTPRFQHEDCELCSFLGHYEGHDLYYCTQAKGRAAPMPTVIGRFGDQPPEYVSGLRIELPVLIEARVRARQKGLLK